MNVADPLERLTTVRDSIHAIYRSAELVVINNLMNFLGSLEPRCVADPIYIDFT